MPTRLLASRFLPAASLALGSVPLLGQTAARMDGRILSEDGVPVVAAKVSYYRAPRLVKDPRGRWEYALDQPRVSSTVASSSDGRYGVSGLPEGVYSLCVDAPGFLPSCGWSGPINVKVSAGAAVMIPEVRLIKAAVLSFRVSDPDRRLPGDDRINRPLVLGVMNEYGSFYAAERVSTDSAGATFEVRIPYSRQLQIWIQSWRLLLAGADKRAIDGAGTRIPLRVDLGTAPRAFELTITGEAGQ